MNITDTSHVLATIQAYTNRRADEATVKAWHELLAPYTVEDCLQAVKDHYRDSTDWLMPAALIARVREYRRDRLAAFHGGLHLSPADDAKAGWRERMAALRSLAANGYLTPAQYGEYQVGRLTLADLTQRRPELGR